VGLGLNFKEPGMIAVGRRRRRRRSCEFVYFMIHWEFDLGVFVV
jgi:hypothetical protein